MNAHSKVLVLWEEKWIQSYAEREDLRMPSLAPPNELMSSLCVCWSWMSRLCEYRTRGVLKIDKMGRTRGKWRYWKIFECSSGFCFSLAEPREYTRKMLNVVFAPFDPTTKDRKSYKSVHFLLDFWRIKLLQFGFLQCGIRRRWPENCALMTSCGSAWRCLLGFGFKIRKIKVFASAHQSLRQLITARRANRIAVLHEQSNILVTSDVGKRTGTYIRTSIPLQDGAQLPSSSKVGCNIA